MALKKAGADAPESSGVGENMTREQAAALAAEPEAAKAEKPKAAKPESQPEKAEKQKSVNKNPEKFVFTHSLPVNGNVGVYVKGEEKSVPAKDGRIEFSESFDVGCAIAAELVKAGWADITEYPVVRAYETPKPSVKVIKGWRFRHPDHSENEPINATIGFYVNDEEVQVVLEKSRCVVTDAQIAGALERKGYIVEEVASE